jgi:hypothetical protein
MTLVPGARPQLRKRARRDWTKAKAERFLGVLAETCNVSEACRRGKVSMTVVYRHRKKDAWFRAAWIEAIDQAYQRLEMVLLDRAFNGTERITTRKDGSEERMREYPNHLGLMLLRMHRDTMLEANNTEFEPDDIEEIRERLVRKLQRMKKRDETKEAGSRELRGSDAPRDGDPQERDGGGAAPRNCQDDP